MDTQFFKHIYVYVSMCWCPLTSEERTEFPGIRIIGGYGLPGVSTEHWTQVFYKSSKCS